MLIVHIHICVWLFSISHIIMGYFANYMTIELSRLSMK